MNEKFFELPKEKQLSIINAAMEVFGKNEYKHAVTDDIAAKAGISKGLLFYYFHNKRALYMYVYEYCFTLMKEMVLDEHFKEIDDFFELLEYGANNKMTILQEYPNIMGFVVRAFYSQHEAISDDVNQDMQSALKDSYSLYFQHVDFSKFRAGVDPGYIYRMLVWMTDGYLHEVQSNRKNIDLDEVMNEYHKWKEMFRKMVYKEEFL